MNIEGWIEFLIKACKRQNIDLSEDKIEFLLSKNEKPQSPSDNPVDKIMKTIGIQETPLGLGPKEKAICNSVLQVITSEFFHKLTLGEGFGDTGRLPLEIQEFIKKHEKTHSAFIKMYITCGTFHMEVQDLFPDNYDVILSQLLNHVLYPLKGLFLPADGPFHVSVKTRIVTQKRILKQYAPDFDVEDFIENNPILRSEESKEVIWLGFVYLLLFLIIAWFIPPNVWWGKIVFYCLMAGVVISIIGIYRTIKLRYSSANADKIVF